MAVLIAAAVAVTSDVARAQGVGERFTLEGGPRELALREAVAIALEDNPDVRTATFRLGATRAGLWEAYGNFLPQLNLIGALQKSGRGQVVIDGIPFPSPETFTTYYQFDVTHRLFDAGRDIFRLDAARAERRAADAQLEDDRLRTSAAVKRAYVAALQAQALRDQAAREIESRGRRLELARARFDLGSVTRSDVLQAQISVSEAEVDVVREDAGIRAAKLDLLRVMGVQADPDAVRLVEPLAVFEPALEPDSLVVLALRESPELGRLRAVIDQRDSESWIAKTAYLPTLQAGASFSSSASDTSEFRFDDLDNRSVYSLSLNWELFGGFARYNETSRARAELRAAEEALRGAELATEAAVRQGYLDLLTAYRTHRLRQESLELARRELELAQERYRIGALSFPDLLESQVLFNAAETDVIRATYDFFTALADLEEASGQSLFPGSS